MRIRLPFDVAPAVPVSSGSAEKPTFIKSYDKDGVPFLLETGKMNTYEYIQSFASDVDINELVRRYARGDVDALNRRSGVFGNFSGLPTNLIDLFAQAKNASEFYYSLPEDFKNDFPSVDDFYSAFSSPEKTEKIMNYFRSSSGQAVTKEDSNES